MHVLERLANRIKYGVDRKVSREIRSAVKSVVRRDPDFCWMRHGQRDEALDVPRTKDGRLFFAWMREEEAEKAEEIPPAWSPPREQGGLTPYQRAVIEGRV